MNVLRNFKKISRLEFKLWNTIISDDSVALKALNINEVDVLTIHLENGQKEIYQVKAQVEIFEVGSEEHYFDKWKVLNTQIRDEKRTSLIVKNSDWLRSFSFIRNIKTELNHYVILGMDKVINIISAFEPEIIKTA